MNAIVAQGKDRPEASHLCWHANFLFYCAKRKNHVFCGWWKPLNVVLRWRGLPEMVFGKTCSVVGQ
jgi:hypothetical protein